MADSPVLIKSSRGEVKDRWWHSSPIVLQLYPSSYKDSNGDGIGDLPGIIDKLDYIKSLGVDAIWLSPHHKSPRIDEGYDISDYQDVHEPFGTLDDCQRLIDETHRRGIKILFDLVINHCSDQHKWFKESRSSKDSPKRDWFFWRPAKYVDGKRQEPNNWRSLFGGSAWEWDEHTQEYYLHYFRAEQPDINWELPVVRRTLYEDAILFWLERGVDGFRIDTCNMYSKVTSFPDAPVTIPTEPYQSSPYYCNGPRLSEYLQEMYNNTFAHYDTLTIGELPSTPTLEMMLNYISRDSRQLDTVILDRMDVDHSQNEYWLLHREWKLHELKQAIEFAQQLADPRNNSECLLHLENHDNARCVSRFASDAPEHRVASAKMLAVFQLTLSGTLLIYQGQEIGMINAPKDWPMEEYIDMSTERFLQKVRADVERLGDKTLLSRAIDGVQRVARDHARTPMHWDSSTSAGFSTSSKTWYRVMESYKEGINVAAQEGDPESVLNFYRRMIALRKKHPDVFVKGLFKLYDRDGDETMVFTKTTRNGKRVALAALNFTERPQPFKVPSEVGDEGELLLSTVAGTSKDSLAPFEARIYLR